MAITAEMRTQVLELYTAYFNRAADKAGVDYWTAELEAGKTLDEISASFASADQAEYAALYAGKTNSELVTAVYQNVLGREPSEADLAYWTGDLDGGLSTENFVKAIVDAATELDADGNAKNPDDKAILDNKIAVSEYAYENNNAATDITLADVTADATTVETLKAVADEKIAAEAALVAAYDAAYTTYEASKAAADAAAADMSTQELAEAAQAAAETAKADAESLVTAAAATDNAVDDAQAADAVATTDAMIAAAIAANPTTPTGVVGGVNLMTTGMDTLTGTENDDRFIAIIDSATPANTTFQSYDSVDGGDGYDTLEVSMSDDYDADSSIKSIEAVEVKATAAKYFDADGLEGLQVVTNNKSTANLTIKNIESIDTHIGYNKNSTLAADTTVTIKDAALTGSTDTLSIDMQKATDTGDLLVSSTGTNGIENVTINSNGTTANKIKSIDVETSTGGVETITKLSVTGTADLTITDALDFKGTATTDKATVDASTMTGGLTANLVDTDANLIMTVTGGKGDDSFTFNSSLDDKDTVDGGEGSDTIVVDRTSTTELTNVTNVENLKVTTEDLAESTIELSGKAISSVTNFIVDANNASDNDDADVKISDLDDGDTITIIQAGADSTSLADGVAVNGTVATDTLTNTLNLTLSGIGAVTANTTNDTGVAKVTFSTIETLNLAANANADSTVTTNGVEELSITAATTLNITGSADLDLDSIVNTTKLTSLDASAATGKLTIAGIDASELVFKAGSDTADISIAGLNNADQLIGGASETDIVTATSVTGLTATTGKLNIQDIETVVLQATGANTIDTSLLTGVDALAISGATPGTQTITNVAASGLAIQLGEKTAEFDNTDKVTISLADATGATDSLTVNVDNRGGTDTDAKLDMSGIETLNLVVLDKDTGNNAKVDLTEAEVSSVVVTGGFAAAALNLDTLYKATTSVDSTGYKGDIIFSAANASSAMTVTTAAATAASDITLSAKDDTITVAETANVDVDVDGGDGTDTLNLTVKTGFIDAGEIDNIENINLTVRAGDDIQIGAHGTAATDANGIDEATKLVLTGGNELSTFAIGSKGATAAADTLAGTTLLTIDASAFTGNIDLEYAADKLLETMDIKAGALTTDTVRAAYDTANTDVALKLNGVENLYLELNSADTSANEQYTLDMANTTGLKTIALTSSDGENTLFDVDNYVSTATIQLGLADATDEDFEDSSEVDINLASNSGTSDTVNLKLVDTDDKAGTIDIDAAGTEVLNIELSTDAQSHKLNLAGVTASTDSNVAITVTGGVSGDGLEITALDSTVNVLDASALSGTLTMTGGSSTATTITGTAQVDTIIMSNAGDVIAAGEGSDTLKFDFSTISGNNLTVDLSSTTDQITKFNDDANTVTQTGFINVDASGYTGAGASITANKAGSIITGTTEQDSITLGAGDDTVNFAFTNEAKNDSISSFAAGSGKDIITFTGTSDVANTTDADGYQVVTTWEIDTTAYELVDGLNILIEKDGTTANSLSAADIATFLTGGANDITIDANNAIQYAVVTDGTDSALIKLTADGDGSADATIEADDITVITTLVGVSDLSTLDTTNFSNFAG